jgi:hypothetical protein
MLHRHRPGALPDDAVILTADRGSAAESRLNRTRDAG